MEQRKSDRSVTDVDHTALQLTDLRSDSAHLLSEMAVLRAELREVSATLGGVTATLRGLDDRFEAFTGQYARDQARNAAEAELTQLTLHWHSHFEQRRTTRALARGLVHELTADAVARGIVDQDTVESCVSERLLMEKSYWLAPALMALATRHRREPARWQRAKGHAYTLDKSRAQLFFSLTCSRLGELGDAAKWMNRYLDSLDPYALEDDFQIVLDAVACNELGHEALLHARQAMKRWAGQLDLARPSSERRQVARAMWELRHSDADQRFGELAQLCPQDWDKLRKGWQLASVPGATLRLLRESFSTEEPLAPTKGRRHTDSALESLIDRLDPDEAAVKDRMEYLQLVVQHKGDAQAARAAHEAHTQARQPMDLGSLLVNAVFEPDAVTLGREARLLALRTVWPEILSASLRHTDRSQSLLPQQLDITVQRWHKQVAAEPTSSLSTEPLVTDLVRTVERRTGQQVDSVRVNVWRLTAAAVLTVVSVGVAVPAAPGPTRVLLGLLCLLGLAWAAFEWWRVPHRRQRLHQEGHDAALSGATALRRGLEQRAPFFAEWRDNLEAPSRLAAWGAEMWRGEPAAVDRKRDAAGASS
ncbi:hypothetical protein [Streptomyces sp. NPDC057877]|uniref:hypothetical protein n=1 Tax=Streptomyces sp. NPDC057877 TaxID=3346269 RepID=UPI0036A9CE83